jgi:hypothetical protein
LKGIPEDDLTALWPVFKKYNVEHTGIIPAKYREMITSSEKLSRLNNIMGIVKYSIDAEGNTQEKIWGMEIKEE